MRNLAIHQITMMEGGPAGLVRFAQRAGLNRICLFTATPLYEDRTPMFPVVEPQDKAAFKTLLDDTGVSITNVEYFPIMPDADVSAYIAALELAAELGAKRAVTHIHETDPSRATDQLAALCETAAGLDLEVGLEFTGFAEGCDHLERAVEIQLAQDQPNLKIAVDALHLFRTGGTLDALRAVDPAVIGYAQICDGPDLRVTSDYLDEAMHRMIPGTGVFPLQEFVGIFGAHVDLDIEVPGFGLQGDPGERAMRAVIASRKLLEERETEIDQ